MNQNFSLVLSVIALALMSCASTEPLESPKSVKKEAASQKTTVKKATKKSTPVKKTSKPKTVKKKAPAKKSTASKIKAPSTATQKPTNPTVATPKPATPVVKKPAPPVVKPPVKLRTATPVLGRDGYVHNPFNFDEHIDVRGTPSGSVVTPDGNPEHKFKVP